MVKYLFTFLYSTYNDDDWVIISVSCAGMLLNMRSSDSEKRSKRSASNSAAAASERPSLLAALHAAGFKPYASCIKQAAVKAMISEELPNDAMWLDRLRQLDALVSVYHVSGLHSDASVHIGWPRTLLVERKGYLVVYPASKRFTRLRKTQL